MKILAFILTTTASLAAAVVLFFFMILGMNGFSESDATWGMGTYVGLAVLISIIAGGCSYVFVAKLIAHEFHPAVSLLIAVPVLTVLAIGLEFVSLIIGVFVSDFVRTHH